MQVAGLLTGKVTAAYGALTPKGCSCIQVYQLAKMHINLVTTMY